MKKKYACSIAVVGTLIFFSLQVSAQARAGSDFIEKKTEDGVCYATGGVGMHERDIMKDMFDKYNFKVSFAKKSGAFVSGVKVVICDAGEKEIISEQQTTGPWLLAELPSGTYTLKAWYEGVEKTAAVTVGDGFKTLTMHW